MARTIPQCRGALEIIAEELDQQGDRAHARRIRAIIKDLYRRPAVRNTPVKHRSVTPTVQQAIRQYAQRHPDASQVEIGQVFGVNPGRVSEALAGKRG